MHNEKCQNLAIYRLNRAKEMILDAKQLFQSGSYKSSNNRAYYAIFHSMRAVLALDEVDFRRHSGVIQFFQKEYIKTGIFDKEYSDIITSASEIRNASDYDDFYIASKDETKMQVESAERFCNAVEIFLNSTIEKIP